MTNPVSSAATATHDGRQRRSEADELAEDAAPSVAVRSSAKSTRERVALAATVRLLIAHISPSRDLAYSSELLEARARSQTRRSTLVRPGPRRPQRCAQPSQGSD